MWYWNIFIWSAGIELKIKRFGKNAQAPKVQKPENYFSGFCTFGYHELFFAYLHQFPKSINFVDALL